MNKKSISALIAVLSVFVLMFGLVACDTQGGGGTPTIRRKNTSFNMRTTPVHTKSM